MATAEELLEIHMADPNAHGGAFGPSDRKATTALRTDVDDVKKGQTKMRAQLNGVDAGLKDVRSEVGDLRGEVGDLDENVNGLRGEVADVRGEVADFRGEVDRKFDLLFTQLGIEDPASAPPKSHVYWTRSLQGPLSALGSLGRPSTRSPMMLRWISEVPE